MTWSARDSNQSWRCVAFSADGTKLVAVASNANGVYTASITDGSLSISTSLVSSLVGNGGMVELLYLGNGLFQPVTVTAASLYAQ
jgi:hypothetical protein